MPFKSKSQQRYMFANMPKTAEKWVEKTPNMKNLPQHVKTEVRQPKVNATFSFYVVERAKTPQDNPNSLYYKTDPISFANQMRGGIVEGDIYGFYIDEDEAANAAHDQVKAVFEAAKALEGKKDLVATKLQKKIDELQKLAETHMKAMKTEPGNAEAHQMKAEGYLARIKELRGKHKSVEKAKKPLEERDSEDSPKSKKPKK